MTEADKEIVDELTKLVAGQLVMKGFISFQDGRNRRAEIEEIARSCLSEVRRHDARDDEQAVYLTPEQRAFYQREKNALTSRMLARLNSGA